MAIVDQPAANARHLKDLRAYLADLDAHGELLRIGSPVDRDYEIGAIARRVYETGDPAPLFENIRGHERGFRVLGAPAGLSRQPGKRLARIALSLGLDPTSRPREIVEALVAARSRPAIKPRVVASSPVFENVFTGDDVDITRIPAPVLHEGDGGRYLNTFGCIVARTPDGRWTNWSIARIMMVDKNRMSGLVVPKQHLGMIHAEWKAIGKAMPFALALGVEPFIPFVCGMPYPKDADEADFAGAYFGEPIEVVRCKTVDLEAPASAEILIEGHLAIDERISEGPMGEYAGFRPDPSAHTQMPVYHVTAMSHRNDPILPISVAGEPTEEDHTAWGIPNAAEIAYELRSAGFPVTMAWSPFESANHLFAISVSPEWQKITTNSDDFCRRVGEALFSTKAGFGTPKYLVVNDDVDVADTNELFWAFCTRNHPGSAGEVLFNEQSVNPLPPFMNSFEKMHLETTKVVYNCLPPAEIGGVMPERTAFRFGYSSEIRERVLKRWREYGFDGAPAPGIDT